MSRRREFTKTLLPWVAAVAGGVLYFLSYPGFDQFYLAWVCLVPALWAIRDGSPRRAFFIGWAAGLAAYAGGFYWVVQMFEEFAGASPPVALLGLLVVAGSNALLLALWAWTTRIITDRAGWSVAWVAPVVWTAVEKLWPEIFQNYFGASQYKLVLATQIADVTGILGLSFLVVFANSTIYAVLEQRLSRGTFAWRPAAVFAVAVGVALGYGAVRIPAVDRQASAAEKLTVGLVQTNVGAGDKHRDPTYFVREHQQMSRALVSQHPVDLLVWPESVVYVHLPDRHSRLPPAVLGDLHTPVLFGAILGLGGDERVYSGAILADGTGQVLGTYEKEILMPFGEYIPLGDTFPWLYSLSPNTGRFWRGSSDQPLAFGRHLLSVNICYEDIFPDYIRKEMRGGRDHRIPEAIFNLTNDSWYGNSVEPMEHLVLASFRAIEHRRALVRSTNTGISAIVDPVGRLDHRTRQWTRETLIGEVPWMHGDTVYELLGDWLGWVCAALSAVGLGRAAWMSRRTGGKAGSGAKS